jgi:hypothetical protein
VLLGEMEVSEEDWVIEGGFYQYISSYFSLFQDCDKGRESLPGNPVLQYFYYEPYLAVIGGFHFAVIISCTSKKSEETTKERLFHV